MLGCREDSIGATVGFFEGFDDGKRELEGIRDGCKYGTLLGPNDTEELSTEGSQVGSGEGSIVGDWVIGNDEVGPTDGTVVGSIGCEVDKEGKIVEG